MESCLANIRGSEPRRTARKLCFAAFYSGLKVVPSTVLYKSNDLQTVRWKTLPTLVPTKRTSPVCMLLGFGNSKESSSDKRALVFPSYSTSINPESMFEQVGKVLRGPKSFLDYYAQESSWNANVAPSVTLNEVYMAGFLDINPFEASKIPVKEQHF